MDFIEMSKPIQSYIQKLKSDKGDIFGDVVVDALRAKLFIMMMKHSRVPDEWALPAIDVVSQGLAIAHFSLGPDFHPDEIMNHADILYEIANSEVDEYLKQGGNTK